MEKGSLNYMRFNHDRGIRDFPKTGYDFLHHFGTGYQELVFDNLADAKRFAEAEKIAYRGPREV